MFVMLFRFRVGLHSVDLDTCRFELSVRNLFDSIVLQLQKRIKLITKACRNDTIVIIFISHNAHTQRSNIDRDANTP